MKKDSIQEVYPGIFRITERGLLGMLKPSVNIYVITGKNGIVYDAGYGNYGSIRDFSRKYKEICNICKDRGKENYIDRILLSHAHADHFSGLNRLRKRWGFRIIISDKMKKIISSSSAYRDSFTPAEKENEKTAGGILSSLIKFISHKIEFRIYALYWGVSFIDNPDIVISSESIIEIDDEQWEIFESPGHSSEHITLYNREKGILFSGDNVLKSINVWLGPPKSDIDQYEQSLEKMLSLPDLKIILPAHGSPILNPYERLKEIIEWRRKRTNDVLKLLEQSSTEGVTVRDILKKLYPSESRMKKEFAGGWVELTLLKFENEKKIIYKNGRYYYNPMK